MDRTIKKNNKKYMINSSVLNIFIIIILNFNLGLYLLYKFISDDYFFKNQLGINIKLDFRYILVISGIILFMLLFFNHRLFLKDVIAKNIITIIQIIGYIFIIKSLIVSYIFYGIDISKYILVVLNYIVLSSLIYLTIFSSTTLKYFEN